MGQRAGFFELARGAMVPTACLLVTGYFAAHALVGNTGLFAWGDYQAQQAELRLQAAVVRERRDALAHRVELLDPRHVDPDLADELVRSNLGVVRPDEVVVPLPKAD